MLVDNTKKASCSVERTQSAQNGDKRGLKAHQGTKQAGATPPGAGGHPGVIGKETTYNL